jgi:hypothetical protein
MVGLGWGNHTVEECNMVYIQNSFMHIVSALTQCIFWKDVILYNQCQTKLECLCKFVILKFNEYFVDLDLSSWCDLKYELFSLL